MKFIHALLASSLLAAPAAAQQQAVLHASDAAARDSFGRSVAVDGSTILVGSSLDNAPYADQGSAYVFVASGASWSQQAKLLPLDPQGNSNFGSASSLSGDSAALGAPNAFLTVSGAAQGAAYVFVRNGTSWSQQSKLTASDAAVGDMFGSAIALDADTLAVGAPLRDDLGADCGCVYVFVRSGSTWTQQAKLLASDGAAGARFGTSLALAGDTLVVGAPLDDGAGLDAGSAYVFVRNAGIWTQQAKLDAADAAAGDSFGRAAAISADTVVLGANLRDQQGIDSGAAYVFQRAGSTWSQSAKLVPSDPHAFAYFGNSVDVTGGTILVGACQDPAQGSSSGSAYVFHDSGSGWSQAGKLVPLVAAPGDLFGNSVALSGATAAVGSPSSDDVGWNAGSAYAFWVSPPGAAFCFGDGSLATACPCANAGAPGRGCDNSAGTGGAWLESTGAASLSHDTVALTSRGELPSVLSIFLQGTASNSSGTVFGDGVRCVAGSLRRLVTRNAVGGVVAFPEPTDPSLSVRSSALGDPLGPGQMRWYQTYYRDPVLGFCPNPPGNSWNVSSGQSVTWWP